MVDRIGQLFQGDTRIDLQWDDLSREELSVNSDGGHRGKFSASNGVVFEKKKRGLSASILGGVPPPAPPASRPKRA